MATLLKKPFKLALVQLASGSDKTFNLRHARSKVIEAAKAGASIIVLPECFNSPYGTQYFPKYAETVLPSPPSEEKSPSWHMLSQVAAETKTYLIGGSIPEYVPETKQYFNTSLVFSPTGELLATHRKTHLFDIDIPGKIKFRESDVLSPGNKVTIIDIPECGKIGLAICYDVRFPELAMIAARKNLFMFVYPGAFNTTTGPMHWTLQARARAMDNQIYVAMCSLARDTEAVYHAYGHSMIVNPNAEVLAETQEHEDIVYAEIDGAKIEETRKGIPIYTQRRFDVENGWNDLLNQVDDKVRDRFFQLTIPFEDSSPHLDETSQIPRLIQMANDNPLDLGGLKRALWASRFFFELHTAQFLPI